MNGGIIATRYARALLGFAKEHGAEERVYGEMTTLGRSFASDGEVLRVLGNPIVSSASKVRLLCAAGGGEVSAEYRRFMELVVQRKREMYLPSMCVVFRDLYHADKKLLYVDLSSAVELDDAVRENIRKRAAEITKSDVRLNTQVDPELIGGFVMKWDTYRMDASVAGQLKRIEKRFKL